MSFKYILKVWKKLKVCYQAKNLSYMYSMYYILLIEYIIYLLEQYIY